MLGTRSLVLGSTTYLATPGLGRRMIQVKAKQTIFAQGSPAESIFYLRQGRAKLTVVSSRGKEATISFLVAGDFVGEEAILAADERRTSTATAISQCLLLKIDRMEMQRALREERGLSELFLKFMLLRGIRTQADLVDQLFNSSERRLARTLLLMAEFGQDGEPITLIPSITQETLAEMIGTTRSRVSFFMNRFRKLGYIEYKRRIRVNKSLLQVVLLDELPETHPARAASPANSFETAPPDRVAKSARRGVNSTE